MKLEILHVRFSNIQVNYNNYNIIVKGLQNNTNVQRAINSKNDCKFLAIRANLHIRNHKVRFTP